MKKADEYANNRIAERDMRSYVEKIKNLQLIGGADAKKKAYAALDKGIAIDPDYHSIYFVMAEFLMERWHGENKHEMINFISKYSAKRKGVEGDILYIKTLLHISYFYEPFNYLSRMGVSWVDLEHKLKSVLHQQPDNKFILNAYWVFSSMALDLERAEEIGKDIDTKNWWITDTWWDPGFHTGNKLKSMGERRKQITVFTFNVLDIWGEGSNLTAYYVLFDAAGNEIGGTNGKRETLTFTDIELNYEPYKVVKYVIIPNTLLKDKVTIKYIIENPNTGNKVEAVKALNFTGAVSAGKDASGPWNINLLKNPSAEFGTRDWRLWGRGDTMKADAPGRGNKFYTEDFLDTKSHFYQDVIVPPDTMDAYVAVAGYLSADEIVTGPGSKSPHLDGYFLHDENKIISNLRDKTMRYDCCQTKCWQPRWGIFKMPPETETIRLFMGHFVDRGEAPNSSRFYYDDLELRLFKSYQEAEKFINGYKKGHPQAQY